MAIQVTGERMRVVWFRQSMRIDLDVDRGQVFGGQRQETYVEAKRKKAAKHRRWRREGKTA